jgi:hypothetical protein
MQSVVMVQQKIRQVVVHLLVVSKAFIGSSHSIVIAHVIKHDQNSDFVYDLSFSFYVWYYAALPFIYIGLYQVRIKSVSIGIRDIG